MKARWSTASRRKRSRSRSFKLEIWSTESEINPKFKVFTYKTAVWNFGYLDLDIVSSFDIRIFYGKRGVASECEHPTVIVDWFKNRGAASECERPTITVNLYRGIVGQKADVSVPWLLIDWFKKRGAANECERPAITIHLYREIAGWSSPVARQAHNLKAAGSNPAPATNLTLCRPIACKGFRFLCLPS